MRAMRVALAGLLLFATMPVLAAGAQSLWGSLAIVDEAREYGFNELQVDSLLSHVWDVGGATQMYGYADDPLGPPGVSAEDAAGTVPLAIGIEYVRFTDSRFLPPALAQPIVEDDELLIPLGTGAMELNRLYVWFWAEMEGEVPFDDPDIGLNIAWPFFVEGSARYSSTFPGDSWTGASHIAGFYNDPTATDPSLAWFAGLFIEDNGSLRTYDGGGGMAWAEGTTVGMYVPADAFMDSPDRRIAEYGYAGDIVLNPQFRFDPEAPRKVTVYPANFGVDGRQGGLEPVYDDDRFTINVGFSPDWDIIDAGLFRDSQDGLWANLQFLEPWPRVDTIEFWLDEYFSGGLQLGAQYDSTTSPLLGLNVHDGEYSLFGTSATGEEVLPTAIWVMNDGSINFHLGIDWSMVPDDSDTITLFTGTAFWEDEDTTERQSVGNQFSFPREGVPVEDPAGDGVESFPAFDLVTEENLDPPASAVTTTSSTTQPATTVTTQPPTTVTTQPGTTTERPRTVVRTGETCWWCWGIVAFFAAFLISIIYLKLKTYEWWSCWIPWFIVMIVWVPFLLAALWFYRPSWWWWPLLSWFPLIGGYTWWWARRTSWWKPGYLYVVGGYLAALAIGTVVVGAPEWGLLLPLFWLPPVAFYLWYRAPRQPWWRPWFYGLFAAYAVWVFIWLASLTVWWAWWLPVVFVPFLLWWFTDHGYDWGEIRGPKWCFAIPFAAIPFLAWWIPLWGPWWCFAIIGFFVLSLVCVTMNHFWEEEWWTNWLVWLVLIFVLVPLLLMGLWFFRPNWWWWPLVAWFPVIWGGTWWWARRQAWWQTWHLYVVGGYLAALVVGMVVVGAPEWGLLLPLFWLPLLAFWLRYRALAQPWFRPWMYLGVAVWAGVFLLWAATASLGPRWGLWYPVVLLPFLSWWSTDHGYDNEMMAEKATWLLPACLLPWLGFMVAIECIPHYYGL